MKIVTTKIRQECSLLPIVFNIIRKSKGKVLSYISAYKIKSKMIKRRESESKQYLATTRSSRRIHIIEKTDFV